ncbi:hypothetical protein ACTNDY_00640 [Tissierellaceae bacterium HCP3S3_D8]
MKKIILLTLVLALLLTGCSGFDKKTFSHLEENGTKYNARIYENRFQVFQDDEWKSINIKAVNIKDTIPLSISGENKIDEKIYANWINSIGEMNANAIKIDCIYPPEFYKSLLKHNKGSKNPIYLLQGIPMDMDFLRENPDPFKLDNILTFKEEISKTIDIIHGHAGSEYTYDVSSYLIGWILGNEWDPMVIDNTNKTRLDKGEYEGDYIYTEDANPFEHFLANVMDHTIDYEMKNYQWQHPISFFNNATTDPLNHIYEPILEENLVSINPNKIKLIDYNPGQFAFYNVYPYYPEFLNLDPKYTKYIDHRGKTNSYAGYIHDLVDFHELPILIGGFGISSSRGMSQINIHNLNDGLNSEESQGNILAKMYEDLIYEKTLGGIISDWQDEWFEKSWSNIQNPKENMGLLDFHSDKISIDGSKKDWTKLKSQPIYETGKKDDSFIKKVYVEHDERYLYMGIEYRDLKGTPLDTLIFLDTIDNQGNTTNPFNENIKTITGTDFIIHIGENGSSRVLVDAYYDPFYYQYGHISKLIPQEELFTNRESELYNPIRMPISKNIKHHRTGFLIPFMDYETGILTYGNGNPESDDYNSLADYCIDKKGKFMELKIPWELMNFVNPSTREIIGDIYVNGIDSNITIDGINISLAVYDPNSPEIFHTLPKSESESIPLDLTYKYTWDFWSETEPLDRLKQSYYIIKDLFSRY